MSDQISNWQPRVGSTGDERYLWPDVAISAGRSDLYSTPPTWAQINGANASGLNQIVAATNKFGAMKGYAALPYVAAGDRMTASSFANIRSRINSIRTAFGCPAHSWSLPSPVVGDRISGLHVFDFRKALYITQMAFSFGSKLCITSREEPYGVHWDWATSTTGLRAGQRISGGAGNIWSRYRTFLGSSIPNDQWPDGSVEDVLLTLAATWRWDGWASFNLEVWKSNADLTPFGTEDWNAGFGNKLDEVSNGANGTTTDVEFNLSGAVEPGEAFTLVLCTNWERTSQEPPHSDYVAEQSAYGITGPGLTVLF